VLPIDIGFDRAKSAARRTCWHQEQGSHPQVIEKHNRSLQINHHIS
jgi:hypothetical protein